MKKILLSLVAMIMSVAGVYADDFKITSSDPAAGSECAGIAKSSYWTFATNMDADASFVGARYTFTDETTGTTLYTSDITKASKYNTSAYPNVWAVKNFSTAIADFKKGHIIKLTIAAYDNKTISQGTCLGTDAITFTGAGSSEYEYSPATLSSITPAAGTELKSGSDNTFVLTFSQGVTIDETKTAIVAAQSTTADFTSITANSDKTVWTLVAPASVIESTTPALQFNVYAKDLNGKTLEGNTSGAYQQEDKSYYKFKYDCLLGSPSLTVEPAAGEVTSLKDFKVSYSGGMDLSYAAGVADITVTNESGSVVATVSTKSSDAAITVDSENNLYATFSLPTEITASGKYTLNIPSKLFALGTEYEGYTSKAQTVEYTIAGASLNVATVDPADGSELAKFPELLTVTFNNPDAVAFANYSLVDNDCTTPEESIVFSGEFTKNSDNTFTSKAGKWVELKLYTGHTYTLNVKAWDTVENYNYGNPEIGAFTPATWTGTTVATTYSPVTLTSLSPADGSTITTGDFTVVFSDAIASLSVEVNNGIAGSNVACTTTSTDSKTWNVTIPESVINAATGSISLNLVAKDADNLYVKGNQNVDPDNTTVITYNCYNGCPLPGTVDPESGSTLESISVIKISNSAGIAKAYLASSPITVTSGKAKALVCTVPDENVKEEEVELGGTPTYVTITLPSEITEAGDYQVNIPAMYFMIGEQMESKTTKQMTIEYTIAGDAPASSGLVITPAAGEVTSLDKFVFTYNDGEFIASNYVALTVTDAAGNTVATIKSDDLVATKTTDGTEWGDPLEITATLATPITAAGTYTLHVPQGAFIVGAAYDNSEATSVTYTIAAAPAGLNFTTDPANGSTVEKISKIVYTFTDAVAADYDNALASSATITNAAGESATSMTMLSWGTDLNQINLECMPITADGTYTVTIPANAIKLDDVPYDKPIVITLTIGNAASISHVENADATDNAVRFNIAGQRVNAAAKGILIKNGKKVVVK